MVFGPRPPFPKGTNKFKILLVKMFSLRQKTNQILKISYNRKNQVQVPSDYNLK